MIVIGPAMTLQVRERDKVCGTPHVSAMAKPISEVIVHSQTAMEP
jgi:hypothetical protein